MHNLPIINHDSDPVFYWYDSLNIFALFILTLNISFSESVKSILKMAIIGVYS